MEIRIGSGRAFTTLKGRAAPAPGSRPARIVGAERRAREGGGGGRSTAGGLVELVVMSLRPGAQHRCVDLAVGGGELVSQRVGGGRPAGPPEGAVPCVPFAGAAR